MEILNREYMVVDEEEYECISQIIFPKGDTISKSEILELYNMYLEEKRIDKVEHIGMGAICCRVTTYKDDNGKTCCYYEYCKPRRYKGKVRFKWQWIKHKKRNSKS